MGEFFMKPEIRWCFRLDVPAVDAMSHSVEQFLSHSETRQSAMPDSNGI